MQKYTLKSKLIFTTLFFIFCTLLLVGIITTYYDNVASDATINEKFTNAHSIQEEFFSQKAKQLELITLLVASEPAFTTYVTEAITYYKKEQSMSFLTSIADLLLERQQQYDFEFAIITDPKGTQLARSDQPISVIDDLSKHALMAKAIKQLQPVTGYWKEKETLFQVAIVPIARGQQLEGFLITGNSINTTYLTNIARLSSTNNLLISLPNHIIAASGDITYSTEIAQQLQNQRINIANAITTSKRIELNVNRQRYLLSAYPLDEEASNAQTYLLTSLALNQILAPFQQARITLIILAFVMAILATIGIIMTLKLFLKELKNLKNLVKHLTTKPINKVKRFKSKDLVGISQTLTHLGDHILGKQALAKHMVELSKKIPEVNDYFWVESDDAIIKPNQIIGSRFKILKKIGAGGMGMVFQAIDTELNEVVALKVLLKDTSHTLKISQLKDEIKFARRIHDSNVVRIHDFGKIGGHVFISMEYIMGYTLADLLRFSHKLRPEAAKYCSIQIGLGLLAAHNEGIVHQDLKPENLIVELDTTVKLMDFGIASAQNFISRTQQHEMIEGTIAYASPEQLQGKGADERSDIYAYGTLIMQLFCGQLPYEESDDEQLMIKKVSQEPTPLSEFWISAPHLLEQLIIKCLAHDPNLRFQSVNEVLTELRTISFY